MFKKILTLLLIGVFLSTSAFGAVDWEKIEPAGTRPAADIDYYVATVNNAALDRLLENEREGGAVYYISASSVGIKAGEVVCSNAGGSLRKFRSNSSVTALTWADIDAGVEANGQTYYVYAVADADAETFTGTISLSATAPSGKTYYKLLGSFYNNASGDIANDDTLINYNNYYALRLGDWVSKSNDTTYQASTDGYVCGFTTESDSNEIKGYTDDSTPPTEQRCYNSFKGAGSTKASGITMPVKRGDYWKVTGASTVWWIPSEREV